jgi:hypothetical protein
MPRMLTLWLDLGENTAAEKKTKTSVKIYRGDLVLAHSFPPVQPIQCRQRGRENEQDHGQCPERIA